MVGKLLTFVVLLSALLPVNAQEVNTDSLLRAAQEEFDSKDLELSRSNLNVVISENPRSASAYLLRAKVFLEEDNPEMALKDLNKYIIIDQGNKEVYYMRSKLYNRLGYHKDYAIQDIDRALQLDQMNVNYYVDKAYYIVKGTSEANKQSDYQSAINLMDQAIAYDHENSWLYRIRADYKFEIGQRLAARTDIDRAIELAPGDALNYDSRGSMRLFMEDFRGAFQDFTKAIDLAPENEDHYRKRAYAYYNSGRYDQAIDDLSSTIQIIVHRLDNNTISSKEAADLLGGTYLIRGSALTQIDNYVEACSDFKRARDLGSRKAINYIAKYCR